MYCSRLLTIVWTLVLLLLANLVFAEVPQIISYQGYLTDSEGVPLDGTYDFNFRIYDTASGGSSLWQETHNGIPVSNGSFHVLLGSVGAPSPELDDALFADTGLWLGITVGSDPEILPRTRLSTSPYTYRVSTIDGASGGSINGNIHTSGTLSSGNSITIDGTMDQITATSGRISFGNEDITTTGYLGIGTLPAADLWAVNVYEDNLSGLGVRLTNTTGSSLISLISGSEGSSESNILFGRDDTYEWVMGLDSYAENNRFQIASGEDLAALVVDRATRYVGIGDIIPGEALDVEGNIKARGALFSNDSIKTTGNITVGVPTFSPGGAMIFADGAISNLVDRGIVINLNNDAPSLNPWLHGIELDIANNGDGSMGYVEGLKIAIDDYDADSDAWIYGQGIYITGDGPRYGTECYVEGLSGRHSAFGGYYKADVGSTVYGLYGYGQYGYLTSYGVYGRAEGSAYVNCGVYGVADTDPSATNWAGYFEGDVRVTGTFDNSKSSIIMDHPLDPDNKYLKLSSVNSPEMKNIFDGVVTLDADGRATVELPEYFEALNENFRYQLTCIGDYAPVYVAEKISDNQFAIAGGQPNMEISWQVTGIRKDAFAKANPMEVEIDKPEREAGKFLAPESFGYGPELHINYRQHEHVAQPTQREKRGEKK